MRSSKAVKVKLSEIKPNPFKKYLKEDKVAIDLQVQSLAASILAWNWWGGLQGRQLLDGTVELCFGHRRLAALIKTSGLDADMPLRCFDYSNVEMLHLLVIENDYRALSDCERFSTVDLLKRWLTKHPEDCKSVASDNLQHKHAGASCISEFIGGAGWSQPRVSELLSRANIETPQGQEPIKSQELNQADNQTTIQTIESENVEAQDVIKAEETKVESLEQAIVELEEVAGSMSIPKPSKKAEITTSDLDKVRALIKNRKAIFGADLKTRVPQDQKRLYVQELLTALQELNV